MICIKKDVRLPTNVAMAVAVMAVNEVLAQYGVDCVITSGIEGKHSTGSLHYVGLAIDFRANTVSDVIREAVITELKTALGECFDVVPSSHGAIHIEYQPKGPVN